MNQIEVIDDFLPDPHLARSKGMKAKFEDRTLQDGQLYKRIAETLLPEVVDALNEHMGRPISLLGMGFRLNYDGEPPNTDIHTDQGWGKYALVLGLSRDEDWRGGTAFWTHNATGADRIRPGDVGTIKAVQPDWNKPDAWHLDQVVDGKFNRALIYRSELFHSRWPFTAFGSTPEDGRLVLVAFFN